MATKIKIKLSRQEYEAVSAIVTYAANMLCVVDTYSLYVKETLEYMKQRFDTKRFKLQNSYTFSLSIVEIVVFMQYVGEKMVQAGAYEFAVYHTIYENQIAPQASRAIQIRMSFK